MRTLKLPNGTDFVYSGRRALLDDFVIPDGQAWRITGLRWEHIWGTFPPGHGESLEILLRADAGGAPGAPITSPLEVTSYTEVGTGRAYFGRPGAESWATFEPVALGPGRYWFEGLIVGPEGNFWLVHVDVRGQESWINYEEFNGLEPASNLFGEPADLNFVITGNVIPVDCPADVTGDGVVDVADLLAVLGRWGPCGDICPEDVDRNRTVDFADLLAVLAAWGPCPVKPASRGPGRSDLE